MTDKKHAVRIGMFMFATGLLVAVVLVVFGGFHFWRHRDRYYIEYPDSVIGLSKGVQVYFNGIQVGNVAEIEVASDDLSRVRVTIDIDPHTQVRTDTTAMLNMSGITGLKVIDLRGGALSAPSLPPGSSIPPGVSTLDKLAKQAETIADQSTQIMSKANKILDGIDGVIANLNAVSDPTALDAIVRSTRETSASLAKAAHDVDAMIVENRGALKDTLASLARSTDGANQLVGEARAVVRSNAGTLQAAIVDFRQAARTFKEFAREVKDKPSRLVFSGSPDERKLP